MSSQSLSTRRGSTSAPDPFGAHAHLKRPSTSTLTIVRVPGSAINLQEPPSTHKKFGRLSGAGTSPNRQSSGNGQSENRLSFAFSSFGQTPSRSDGHSPISSPNTSPRIRPSSPHWYSTGLVSKPRLSAEQLVDLARHSVIARPTPGSTPHSPVLSLRPHSPHQLSAPPVAHPTPPTFTPLPDDIYLPFIHRAEEVSQLISTPPTTKLFALLSQAFNKRSEQDDSTLVENTVPPGDPVQWTYPQLIHHLTKVDRDFCSDADWVFGARKCIMSHSELIWERVKAALGVPPELDVDEPEDEEQSLTFSLDDSAFLDSPITDRSSFGSEHAPFGADIRQRLRDELEPISGTDTPVPAGQNADLARVHSPHGDAPIQVDVTSPPLSGHDDLEASHLTIEPLLSTSSHSSHPPPLSLSSSLSNAASDGGLGDIAEGAEDEAEQDETDETKPQDDPELIDPMQIQGLRISTGTLTPSDSVINSPVASTSIPLYNHGTNNQHGQSPPSKFEGYQPPSMSPAEKLLSSRSSITRGRAGLTGRSYRRTRPASMSSYDPRDWDIDMPYDVVAERGPGNPLFPSNFARLALGPTLRANNPSLRTPIAPPPSRYTPGVTLHSGAFTTTGVLGRKARSQSWAMPLRDAESEYALVGRIESSVGE